MTTAFDIHYRITEPKIHTVDVYLNYDKYVIECLALRCSFTDYADTYDDGLIAATAHEEDTD